MTSDEDGDEVHEFDQQPAVPDPFRRRGICLPSTRVHIHLCKLNTPCNSTTRRHGHCSMQCHLRIQNMARFRRYRLADVFSAKRRANLGSAPPLPAPRRCRSRRLRRTCVCPMGIEATRPSQRSSSHLHRGRAATHAGPLSPILNHFSAVGRQAHMKLGHEADDFLHAARDGGVAHGEISVCQKCADHVRID